jgi:hypothetical protein
MSFVFFAVRELSAKNGTRPRRKMRNIQQIPLWHDLRVQENHIERNKIPLDVLNHRVECEPENNDDRERISIIQKVVQTIS